MRAKFRNLHFSHRAVPLGLLLLCLAAFAPLVGLLGYYWDDWPTIWYLHNFGPASFKEGFASDRPLLAYVFMLTTTLIGESTLGWQVFGIFTRWLCALLFWWSLRLIWPGRIFAVTVMAVIFAIYPGFRQQYISVTYSNGFLVYGLYLLSLASMLLAQRKPRWRWLLMLLSLASSTLTLFISEYFFGLELLRPVLLWMMQNEIGEQKTIRIRRVILQWLPYLASATVFLIWRLFLHTTPRGNLVLFNQLEANPSQTLVRLLGTILQDTFEVSILAWIKTVILPRLVDFSYLYILAFSLVIVLAGGMTALFLRRLQIQSPTHVAQSFRSRWKDGAGQMLLLGLYTLLISGWPIWVTDLHFELIFPWDRFTLMMMPGIAMLTGGVIALLIHSQRRAAILVGVLAGLSAGMHLHDAVVYRQEWLAQKDFFWQLAWRAPGLQRGSVLLTADSPFTYYSDNSLSAPLNWMYSPGDASLNMPYLVYNIESRLWKDLPGLDPGLPIDLSYRVTHFQGSTSQAVVVFYVPPRCLKVMHPLQDLNLPYKPLLIPEAMALSRPELILGSAQPAAAPPNSIFGPEPEPNWCYYFEKADLANQMGDWEAIVALSEPAFKLGKQFDRETASELVPFIKAFAHSGKWERAIELSLLALNASPKMQNMLCQTWYLMRDSLPPGEAQDQAYASISEQMPCKFP